MKKTAIVAGFAIIYFALSAAFVVLLGGALDQEFNCKPEATAQVASR